MVNKVSKESFSLEDFGFCSKKLCIRTIPPTKGGKAWRIFALRARKMAAPNFKQEDWGKRDIYLAQF